MIPLSPTLLLDRAAAAFGERTAIVDGDKTFTYREFCGRAHRLAGALRHAGIASGDRVAALCANSHVMLEIHNGVPLAGAVLVPMNVRLAARELEAIVEHAGARLLIATPEWLELASHVAAHASIPLWIADDAGGEYERRIEWAEALAADVDDERSLLAINYTSGSTGRPKGVMCSHRGAYLQAIAVAYHTALGTGSRYLWTLPMFHCNGWCLTWGVTAAGATHVCQRLFDARGIWLAICEGGITHLSAAPTALGMIAEAAALLPDQRPRVPVHVDTGGAPPSPALLGHLAALGMQVMHLYGLTESYGPVVANIWQPEWSDRPVAEQYRLNARQGVGNVVSAGARVIDRSGAPTPADGRTIGEIVLRGNNIMLGYYRDEQATRDAFIDGWLRTGDMGVLHPDGYIELTDRAKDIIITGGENIASVEVERVLAEHEAVLEAAVVGRPHELWGEEPVAFVVLKNGCSASESELIEFARARLAHFKAPRHVRFEALPKTSTGKVQKHVLRARLRAEQEAHGTTHA